jgi:hypothetical protein
VLDEEIDGGRGQKLVPIDLLAAVMGKGVE